MRIRFPSTTTPEPLLSCGFPLLHGRTKSGARRVAYTLTTESPIRSAAAAQAERDESNSKERIARVISCLAWNPVAPMRFATPVSTDSRPECQPARRSPVTAKQNGSGLGCYRLVFPGMAMQAVIDPQPHCPPAPRRRRFADLPATNRRSRHGVIGSWPNDPTVRLPRPLGPTGGAEEQTHTGAYGVRVTTA